VEIINSYLGACRDNTDSPVIRNAVDQTSPVSMSDSLCRTGN